MYQRGWKSQGNVEEETAVGQKESVRAINLEDNHHEIVPSETVLISSRKAA